MRVLLVICTLTNLSPEKGLRPDLRRHPTSLNPRTRYRRRVVPALTPSPVTGPDVLSEYSQAVYGERPTSGHEEVLCPVLPPHSYPVPVLSFSPTRQIKVTTP